MDAENETNEQQTNTGTAPVNQADNNAAVQTQQTNEQAQAPRTFSQEDVNSMMAKEKRQGRSSVFNELGIDPNDADTINLVKQLVSARTSSEQVEAANDAEARILEAEQRAVVAEMKAEVMTMGAGPQYVDDVVTLALSRLDADENADLKTVIGEIKTKYPALFSLGGSQGGSTDTSGTGSPAPESKGKKDEGGEVGLGKRLAMSRRNAAPKKSFWS